MTAEKAYKLGKADIESQLQDIKELVDLHEKNALKEGVTWSHCGDIDHVANVLEELISFMRNEG